MTAAELARDLSLVPHPEGGFYRETYRSPLMVPTPRGPRAASTAILFLLTAESFSALHRIASDELWHFHAGDTLEIVRLGAPSILLGGGRPQAMVPAGEWFGARLAPGGAWALCGCTVAPGFDFADFEMGERAALTRNFPSEAALIAEMTRP